MIDIVISNGDRAEADSPEEAVFAAAILIREASAAGAALRLLTASFFVGSRHVRSGVRYAELPLLARAVAR